MSTDDDTTITTPWHAAETGPDGVFIDGEKAAEGPVFKPDPAAFIHIGFHEITDALALLRKLRTFEQARGMWPTAWHELDELLDRIDGVTAA